MKTRAIMSESQNDYLQNPFYKTLSEYISKNTVASIEANSQVKSRIDPNTRRLLAYLFTGTRGGINRLRIVLLLAEKPLNLNQIAKELALDYNAIQFHIEVLEKNNLVSRAGERYGALFFLSTFLEHNIESFNEIVVKIYKNLDMKSLQGT